MTSKVAVIRDVILAFVVVVAAFGQIAAPHIGNFGVVEEGAIYRGAQPSEQGFRELAASGVTTVLDLRRDGTVAWEKTLVEKLGMQFVHLPMNGLAAPTKAQIAEAMRILETAKGPVFIHCQHGSDRTGTVVACWRIGHEGWTKEQAQKEANAFHMSPAEVGMRRFIRKYLVGR